MFRIASANLKVSSAPRPFWWNRYLTENSKGIANIDGAYLMYDAS